MSLLDLVKKDSCWQEIKVYLKNHTIKNSELNQAFQKACSLGLKDTVAFFLKQDGVNPKLGDPKASLFAISPSLSQGYGLQMAVYNGHLETVKILLDDGRSVPFGNNFKILKLALFQAEKSTNRIPLLNYLNDYFYDHYIDWRSSVEPNLKDKIEKFYLHSSTSKQQEQESKNHSSKA